MSTVAQPSPLHLARLAAARRAALQRPPCPIDPNCRIDHLTRGRQR